MNLSKNRLRKNHTTIRVNYDVRGNRRMRRMTKASYRNRKQNNSSVVATKAFQPAFTVGSLLESCLLCANTERNEKSTIWVLHELTAASGEHIKVVTKNHAMFRIPPIQGPKIFVNRYEIVVENHKSELKVLAASLTDVAVQDNPALTSDIISKVKLFVTTIR